jgi:hypothetical protein
MARLLKPCIGNWYHDPEEESYFEVVAVDDHTATIEIQYLDGEIGELDIDLWFEMHPVAAQPPKNANAAFGLSCQDYGLDSESIIPEALINPINQIESELFQGFDDF